MKRIGALILLCCILVCSICGCANTETNKTALDYVDLCDYKSLEVSKEEYVVSDTDLSTAIQMHMSSLNIEASELSDSIAVEYFNCQNANAVREMIKKEIIENRFYEAARDMILESSLITGFPEDSKTYVNNMVSAQKVFAEAEGISLSEYLDSYYKMTEEEFREAALCGYGDIMILKAIAEKEDYKINSEEYNNLIESTAEYVGMSTEETVKLYGEEYFECLLYEDFLRELIKTIYRTDIDEMAKT